MSDLQLDHQVEIFHLPIIIDAVKQDKFQFLILQIID
jgi:hypothetical protein